MVSIRSLVVSGMVTVGAAGAGAVVANTGAFDDETDRDRAGTIVESGGLGAFAVKVGDCVQLPDAPPTERAAAGLIESVEGVPCEQPHDAQAYATFDLVGITTYDEAVIDDRAQRMCLERWSGAIGTDYLRDRGRDVVYFMPSEQSWTVIDDRAVMCFVVRIGGAPLVGSQLVED